jgi:hypothetical protein
MASIWIQVVESENEEKFNQVKNEIMVVVGRNFTPPEIKLTILNSLPERAVFEGIEFHGNDLSMKVIPHPRSFRELGLRTTKNSMKVRFHGLRHKMNKPIAFNYMNSWLDVFNHLYFEMLDINENVQYWWKKGCPTFILTPQPFYSNPF